MKIPISIIERKLNRKVKKDFTSVGFDWASRAGIAYIKSDKSFIEINVQFIEFKGNEKKEKYKMMVKSLENLINLEDLAVIEDVFIGFNRAGSMELSKYMAFAIAECIKKGVNFEMLTALQCRSKLGIKTTKNAGYGKGQAKRAVSDYLKNNFNIQLDDEDASDAIILALSGILEGLLC